MAEVEVVYRGLSGLPEILEFTYRRCACAVHKLLVYICWEFGFGRCGRCKDRLTEPATEDEYERERVR